MTKVVLIGPSDLEKLSKFLDKHNSKLDEIIEKIGNVLVKKGCEVVFLPDRGISLEVAKKYIISNGKKVYMTVPLGDKEFGIKHLKPYIAEIEEMCKEFSVECEIINTENWYKQDVAIGTYGDTLLVLGCSLGTLLELFGAMYLKKYKGRPKIVIIIKELVESKKVSYLVDAPQMQLVYTSVDDLHQYL